ncbi:MAG TPA: TonB dependent receptor [Chitinophagaceae bacterium]|jgi:hypothetical protein|nr:TonB dependent receptor [Chitinophagaceae bacterium]
MKKNVFLMLIVFFLFVIQVMGQQQSTLKGLIADAENKPVVGATITLQHDSGIRKTISNELGAFIYEGVSEGKHVLTISAVGFVTQIDTLNVVNVPLASVNHYVLKQEIGILTGVSVTAKKAYIEQKIDRTVLNVDALISNAGLTALDVLENAPGVLVSSEGAVSLKGKTGVIIFIDDKPTYLSGADLANYLKSIPSSTLDKIEIMPNPPARYEASGNAGVINIRTKKNRLGGFNAGINLAFGQGKYARTNNSVNFNYRKQKINVFGTASYSINNGFNDLDIFRYYFNDNGGLRSTFFQNSFIRTMSYSPNVRLGIDYFLNDKTTIGWLVNGTMRHSDVTTKNKSIVGNAAGATDSLITADNTESMDWKKGSINMNYLHKFNQGKELSFDVDFINYWSQQDQAFLNSIFNPSGNLKNNDGLTGDLPSLINIYSAKGDYTHSLSPTTNFSGGGKISSVSTDNRANYFIVLAGNTQADFDKTNHFQYKETISAVYLNVNKEWNQWSLQTGLRLENTISDGHQLGNVVKPDSTFRKAYTNLFPTLYLLYKLDTLSTHQLSFSYGRRIDRPFYQDLDPFISPLDKFSLYVGNPYLKPSFTHAFEVSHVYKNKITTTLSYNMTTDIVQETIDLSNSIYISRPANIGTSSVLGISVTSSLKPTTWWTSTLFAEGQNRTYKGLVYDYALDTNVLFFSTNMTHQFTLSKGWSAELSGNYRTGLLVGQIISSQTGRLNIALAKKILRDKGTLKLNVRDVLHTGLNHGIITSIKGAYATYHNWGDTRNILLNFSYNFGKSTKAPRVRYSGAESEQNRVKN